MLVLRAGALDDLVCLAILDAGWCLPIIIKLSWEWFYVKSIVEYMWHLK